MTVTLKGMTWDHPRAFEPMLAASAEYSRLHPQSEIEIVWEKRSLQAFADHPLDELAAEYDLIVIDHPHVGSAADAGCLIALDDRDHDEQLGVLAQQSVGRSHESYQYDGHQWALAIDTASHVAAYRPDQISAAQIPRSWSQVIDLAKQGKVLWPVKPVDAMMSFLTLMANINAPLSQNKPYIEHDDGLRVLHAMASLMQYVPESCLQMNPIAVLDLMGSNDQWVYCPLLFGYSNYSRNGFCEHTICFEKIPVLGSKGPRGAILGGTGIAVSSQSAEIDRAVDFAFWVASADAQKGIYFHSGGQPANAIAWEDPLTNSMSHDFFGATRDVLDHSYLRPRDNGFLSFQDAGGDIINEFLASRLSADKAIMQLDYLFRRFNQNSH